MKLTNHEKGVLLFLLEDGRVADSTIASQLKITTQAVGKIRKKLTAQGTIKNYVTKLNYKKLGITSFAIAFYRVTQKGWAISKRLTGLFDFQSPNLIGLFRVPYGDIHYVAWYGFKNVMESDHFFHLINTKLSSYIAVQDMYTFSVNSIAHDSFAKVWTELVKNYGKTTLPAISVTRHLPHQKKSSTRVLRSIEKELLKELVRTPRSTDVAIAQTLKMTTRAIGKIRSKLVDDGFIQNFSATLDFQKLGLTTFCLAFLKEREGTLSTEEDKGVNNWSKQSPHVIHVFRIPGGEATHIVLFAFRNVQDLDNYFNNLQSKRNNLFSIGKSFVFSYVGLKKLSPNDLYVDTLDDARAELPAPHLIEELRALRDELTN